MKKELFTYGAMALFSLGLGAFFALHNPAPIAEAYGECSQYGLFAQYDPYSNSCSCIYGYRFDTTYGITTCVSNDTYCTNHYGYGAQSDFAGGCKCRSGYLVDTGVLGNQMCVLADSYCRDLYGTFAKYDTLSNSCKCSYGYVLSQKSYGSGLECQSCTSKHGIYSQFNSLTDTCECQSGYTLDNNSQCVKKQNNAYFLVLEHQPNTREAIIQSEYSLNKYLVKYGYGCFTSTFGRYVGDRIVVNMGTDFYVDVFDKIVLQNDNEDCDILDVDPVSFGYTFDPVSPPPSTSIPIPEGALIRASGDLDVYIVKYMGNKKFKRLILSPSVFNSYGHLRWDAIQTVSTDVRDSFVTADLVRAVGDDRVWRLFAQGDTGERRWISTADAFARLGFDAEAIYEINSTDRDSYLQGPDLE